MEQQRNCKYKTYEELAVAFRSGELSRDWHLQLDNDNCYLHWDGQLPEGVLGDDDKEEEFRDDRCQEGMKLFTGGGECNDYEEAVRAAGIPCRWC